MPGDGHELQAEGAHLELVTALDLHLPGLKMMLLALGINKPQSQLRADQRNVRTQPQQIRHPSDMILMPMSQHQSIHPIQLILDIAEVRQNQIHARLLLLRKQHAAVNQQNMTVILDHIHIAANLTQTPQRDNTHGTLTILRRSHQTLLSLSTLTTGDSDAAFRSNSDQSGSLHALSGKSHLILIGTQIGQPHGGLVQSAGRLQSGLSHDSLLTLAIESLDQRVQTCSQIPCAIQVAGIEFIGQALHRSGGYMGDNRYDADGTQGQEGHIETVVA